MRFTQHILSIIIFFLLFLGGGTREHKQLQREIDDLHRKGITTHFLNDTTIAIEQAWSGFKRAKTLSEPTEGTIRTWATQHNVPVLEIDPTLIDTNLYSGRYTYWTTVPISNTIGGPLLVGDLNRNGKSEIYGLSKEYLTDYMSHVYEIDTNGNYTLLYNYVPRRGSSMQFVDTDTDSLKEVVLNYGDSCFNYEQTTPTSLPTRRNFNYGMWQFQGTAIWTFYKMTNLDNDSHIDFIYRGSEPDSVDSVNLFHNYTYVAEFNPSINNFQRVWKTQLLHPPWNESGIGGYDVGDYDSDGKMEFLASEINGTVWVVENNGDNSYHISWADTLPFINLFYQTSGDVDNDGKREFFVGATTGSGNWTTVFEADSDNHYSPKFLFHLLSGGSLDEPIYLTNDVDNDGKLELVIFSGADLYVFKSDGDNSYYLWYYYHANAKEGVQFYDFNGDGRKDFIISKSMQNGNLQLRLYADVYKSNGTLGVGNEPHTLPNAITFNQNYPNPFNNMTILEFTVNRLGFYKLTLYDINGKNIGILLNNGLQPGTYKIQWDGNNFSSGIYFCQLSTNNYSVVRKMILLK
ncbi:MAG: T9SS type A sorting domain-containing protein [Ignavibacteriales bacterium]|nr:T9SS type A sorting domain-containing protein [Ignavibacteriales bacterium]